MNIDRANEKTVSAVRRGGTMKKNSNLMIQPVKTNF